jgi:cytochrome c2
MNTSTSVWFYLKVSSLFIVLVLMVGFNFALWGLHRRHHPVWHVAGAHPERGPTLIESYGCSACHTIPGVAKATGTVGPSLDRMNDQIYLAGTLPNTPPNLMLWIQNPREIRPQTAMPDLGVSQEDARDMAAYLYVLKSNRTGP